MAGWGKAGGEPGNLASRWLAGPLVSGGTRCSYQNASFRANRLGGGGTHLWRRQLCPVELRSHATPRSPNAPIAGVRDEPRLSDCFQARTVRHEAGRDILPQRHQELPGQRHGGNLSDASADDANPVNEPTREFAVRL